MASSGEASDIAARAEEEEETPWKGGRRWRARVLKRLRGSRLGDERWEAAVVPMLVH